MTDLEYAQHADTLLQHVERRCDAICDSSDVDIDSQRSGGMITLTFPNASQIILNKQPPLQEIWLAAKSGGYHFKWSGREWLDTKGQGEITAVLTREASAQAGSPLNFKA